MLGVEFQVNKNSKGEQKMDIELIKTNLKNMETQLGFNPLEIEQKSDEWHFMRLGLVTASNFWKILPSERTKKYGDTRKTYMRELVTQIADREAKENITSKQMDWGNQHEPAAREKYAMILNMKIHELSFIFSHNGRAGLSVDGLTDVGLGFEIKCPYDPANHTKFIVEGQTKKEYIHQVNSSMWMTEAEAWHNISYNPRCTVSGKELHATVFRPNQELFGMYEEELGKFLYEMDKMLMSVYGIKFDHKFGKSE